MGSSLTKESKDLFEAAAVGDAVKLRPLAEKLSGKKRALNWKNPSNEQTALCVASDKGFSRCVKILASTPGVDVSAVDKNGASPLYLASSKGSLDSVKELLLISGIDVNKVDSQGSTALWSAACHGHADVVKLLLAAPGVDFNKESHYGLLSAKEKKAAAKNKTPLYAAVANGHKECVKLLLAQPGIEVNKATWDGRTPLSVAASDDVRQMLTDKGGH